MVGIKLSVPLVFISADEVRRIKRAIFDAPDPNVLPWEPLPELDRAALELQMRREEARKRLEREREEAAKRVEQEQLAAQSMSNSGRQAKDANPVGGSGRGAAWNFQQTSSRAEVSGKAAVNTVSSKATEHGTGKVESDVEFPSLEVPPGFEEDAGENDGLFGTSGRRRSEKNSADGAAEASHRRRSESGRDRLSEEADDSRERRRRRAARTQNIDLSRLKTQIFGN